MRTRIKVCGITTLEEALSAIECGADALGFHPIVATQQEAEEGELSGTLAREIIGQVPPPIATVLLSEYTAAEEILPMLHLTQANTLQLLSDLQEGSYEHLRLEAPTVKLIQTLYVDGEQTLQQALDVEPLVDALLLMPTTDDMDLSAYWQQTKAITEAVSIPVFLQAPFTPITLSEAVGAIRPFGIDLAQASRTEEDALDVDKLWALARAL